MIRCWYFRRMMMTGASGARWSEHAAECPRCGRFLAEWRQAEAILQAAAQVRRRPPEDLWRRIEARLPVEPATVPAPAFSGMPAFSRALLALAATVLLAVGSWLALKSSAELTDPAALAQLDAFELSVPGNPFLQAEAEGNPFFALESGLGENPFRPGGGRP